MVWFRTDDGFNGHPKVVAIPRGAPRLRAVGLWHAVGVWCAQQLTDGAFPPAMIAEQGGTRADARWLLDVGLWHAIGEGCGTETCPAGQPGLHQMHDYLTQNPSRAKVHAERDAAAERKRRGREAQRKARESGGVTAGVTDLSRRDGSGSHGGPGDGGPDPTRPDPTVVPTELLDDSAGAPSSPAGKPRAKRATARPADFRPTDAHVSLAEELKVDLRAEWPKFCDFHDAKGSTFRDWPAALRTWIRNAVKYQGARTLTAGPSNVEAHMDLARRLAEQERGEATVHQIGGGR